MRPTFDRHYWFWVGVICFLVTLDSLAGADDPAGLDELGTSIPELLELRGYGSKSHSVVSQDYPLDVIRIINPLVLKPPKMPVIFVHGMNKNGAEFIKNSIDARPKDLSGLKVADKSIDELVHLLVNDPASNSLALLLSNFGHDVWLWNRRAASSSFPHLLASDRFKRDILSRRLEAHLSDTIGSAIKASLRPVMNAHHWNYSLDEQALNDLPKVIDYVLAASDSTRVSLVGHSAGSAITLMLLSNVPEFANKLANIILYAPALHLGNDPAFSPNEQTFKNYEPIFNEYNGPIDMRLFKVMEHTIDDGLCRIGIRTDITCNHDGISGYSGGQNIDLPNDDYDVCSSHEVAHLLQSVRKTKMHRFDYDSRSLNMKAYGSPEPPIYNTSNIVADRLSIWQGNNDALVTQADTRVLLDSLRVKVDYHLINSSGINFNHDSFLVHRNVSTLVNIPALQIMESAQP